MKLIKIIIFSILVYFLFKDVNLTELFDTLYNYSLPFLILSFLTTLLGDFFISYRWHILTDKKCPIKPAFESFIVSAFLNNILPAKLGEFARVIYLKKLYHFSMNNTLAVLFIERLFDVLMLGTFSLFALTFYIDNEMYKNIFYAIVAFIWIFILMIKYKKEYFILLISFMPIRVIKVYGKKIINNINRILSLSTTIKTLSLTFFVWLSYAIVTLFFLYFVAEFELSFKEMMIVFIVSAVGMSIPLAPAGTGTFHAGVIISLGWFGIGKEEALMSAIVLHLIQIVPPTLISAYIFYKKELNLGMFKK